MVSRIPYTFMAALVFQVLAVGWGIAFSIWETLQKESPSPSRRVRIVLTEIARYGLALVVIGVYIYAMFFRWPWLEDRIGAALALVVLLPLTLFPLVAGWVSMPLWWRRLRVALVRRWYDPDNIVLAAVTLRESALMKHAASLETVYRAGVSAPHSLWFSLDRVWEQPDIKATLEAGVECLKNASRGRVSERGLRWCVEEIFLSGYQCRPYRAGPVFWSPDQGPSDIVSNSGPPPVP